VISDDLTGQPRSGPQQPESTAAQLRTDPGAYFDRLHRERLTSWEQQGNFYEHRKRSIVMATLPRDRYRSCFEPGCSTGLLTELLAARCEEVLAADVSEAVLEETVDRLAQTPGVRIERRLLPLEWPEGRSFDLIVLSDLGYYLDEVSLDHLVVAAAASLSPGGTLLACHWRHPVADSSLTGDMVHARLRTEPSFEVMTQVIEQDFIIDVFETAGEM